MPSQNVTDIKHLSPERALNILRKTAKDSSRVFFVEEHAEDRMEERGISRPQVFRCLRKGKIIQEPEIDEYGLWRMGLNVLAAGDSVTVIASLDYDDKGNYIIVVTTYIR